MEVRTGYKQSEVGIIPDDWKIEDIKSCAYITTGKKNTQDRIYDGIYPFFVRSQTIERINSYSFDGEAVLTAGDGVGTGKIFHYINGKFDFHQRVYKISHFRNDLNGYFFYLYFSNHFYNRIMQMTAKSSVDSIRLEMISKMRIPLPPLPAQKAIAEVLSDTDNLLLTLEKQIAKKRLIKQGAIQQLLIPKDGWKMTKLGDIMDISGGLSATREQLSIEGYCYLHYGDIHGARKTYIDVKKDFNSIPKLLINLSKVPKKSLLKNGDIVFVDASEDDEGVSRHIVIINKENIPFISGLHTIIAKSKDETLDAEFKKHCFQSKYIKSQFKFYAVGTKVSGISKSNIINIKLLIPSKSEQIKIASILGNMDSEIEALESKLSKYKSLKQGLMQNLLNGKIRLKQT